MYSIRAMQEQLPERTKQTLQSIHSHHIVHGLFRCLLPDKDTWWPQVGE